MPPSKSYQYLNRFSAATISIIAQIRNISLADGIINSASAFFTQVFADPEHTLDTLSRRTRTRYMLILMILITIPCYILGIVLLRLNSGPLASTPTPVNSPTITRTATITLTPYLTRTPTITPTITQTLTPTLTRTPTITPTITQTPTNTPELTEPPVNTDTPGPEETPTGSEP